MKDLPGKLISIEGIDGAGKTTLIAELAERLADRGKPIEVVREPGGVALSERIRLLVKDPALQVSAQAEALLYAAARAQLVVEKLLPQLRSGAWVLVDRYVDSSLAYQGGGRDLGVNEIAELNQFATQGLMPDLTILLHLDPKQALARQRQRGVASDRLEAESIEFFLAVTETYGKLASREPERFYVIDATQKPADIVDRVLRAVLSRFGSS